MAKARQAAPAPASSSIRTARGGWAGCIPPPAINRERRLLWEVPVNDGDVLLVIFHLI